MARPAPEDAHARLIQSAQRWVTADDRVWDDFAGAFAVRTYDRSAHLVRAGNPAPEVHFVVEGLLRLYYTDREGREWNKAFTAEGGFAGSVAAGLLGVSASYGVQSLEPTTTLVTTWPALEALYDRHPPLERLGRRLAEQIAVKKELKERAFLERTATERYEAFVRDEPALAARLPLYHVASYVGVTEVSLSRIRGRLARTA